MHYYSIYLEYPKKTSDPTEILTRKLANITPWRKHCRNLLEVITLFSFSQNMLNTMYHTFLRHYNLNFPTTEKEPSTEKLYNFFC